MKILLLCVVTIGLVSCSHQEEKPPEVQKITAKGLKLDLPGIIKFTADDLKKLSGEKEEQLSEGRTAKCNSGGCELNVRGTKLNVRRKDISDIVSLHSDAVSKNSETTKQHGPITVRCKPDACQIDLFLEDNAERNIRFKNGKVELDAESELLKTLLQLMWSGMIKTK